jgi:competence protein ComEC
MVRTSTLVFFVLSFMCGVVLFTTFDFNVYTGVFFLLLGGVVLLPQVREDGAVRTSFFVSLFFIALGCGVLRADVSERFSSEGVLDNIVGQSVTLEGRIVDEPDEREGFTHIVVDVESISHENVLFSVDTKIKVTTDVYPIYTYGDRVVLEGVLDVPKSFETDLGREFDYAGYLAKDKIHYQMFYPEVEKVGSGEGVWIKEQLFVYKHALLENISKVLHEPYAALAGGLIVGAKQSLGEDLLQKFRDVGLIHIVVLSGYNVTIIAITIMYILSFLPRLWRVGVGSVAIILFTIMTGAGATIVRASIMAILIVVGKNLGRKVDLLRLLAIAVFFMVLHNPMIVVYDPSFQLSALAMLGLILLPSVLEKYVVWIPEKFGFREIILATVSTQIFVLPALMYMTGQVSVVSLVVNILVLPIIPITMLFGFLTGIAGFISTGLSGVFAWLAFIFLYYEVTIVELFAKLPFASLTLPSVSPLFVFVCYTVLCFTIWRFHKNMVITKKI